MFVGWVCRYLQNAVEEEVLDGFGKSGSTEIYFTIDQTFDKAESIGIFENRLVWARTVNSTS